jgi:hypothetical protein
MQEHIRRAHPEHYISKLPATEESFQLMINTPPSEKPPPQPNANLARHGLYHSPARHTRLLTRSKAYGNDRNPYYREDSSAPNTPRNLEEYHSGSMLPAASAAAALAQLHNHKIEPEWESEIVCPFPKELCPFRTPTNQLCRSGYPIPRPITKP